MSTTMAIPGNTASTFLVHLFGGGLADERYAVERFKAAADGDIRPWPGADGAAVRRKAKPPVVSRKQAEELRPRRAPRSSSAPGCAPGAGSSSGVISPPHCGTTAASGAERRSP